MQIKSWQIVLAGVIAHGIAVILLVMETLKIIYESGSENAALKLILVPFLLIVLGVGIIVSYLLYLEKTRKFGAIISTLFGITATIFISRIIFTFFMSKGKFEIGTTVLIILASGGLIGFAFLLAGIHYFLKKV